ncbi:MAG: hypothetical protein P8X90_19035 [Desulfobacterales bacterium]|jgi:hypothetical protein
MRLQGVQALPGFNESEHIRADGALHWQTGRHVSCRFASQTAVFSLYFGGVLT